MSRLSRFVARLDKVALLAVVSVVLLSLLYHTYFTPRWAGYVHDDTERNPRLIGKYLTPEACLAQVKAAIATGVMTEDSTIPVHHYFCGKDCYIPGDGLGAGSWLLNELQCSETHTGSAE